MSEILISDEEKEQWFMGDVALDRVKYERKIEELEARLREIGRHTEATIKKAKVEHEKALEDARQEHSGSFNKINELEGVVRRLQQQVKLAKEKSRKQELSEAYREHLEKKLGEISKKDPARLLTELENAKMMIIVLHNLHTGGSSIEMNNLICAIKEYAKSDFDVDFDDYTLGPHYRQMVEAHVRDIWQPHKTVTGAWTKDADPSVQPFCGVLEPDEK
jgi:C4-type Zn-finger protein